MNYKTKGVCSREITFDVQDHKVVNVHFNGGCSGNTQGLSRLVEGMDIDEAIHRLEGIKCGFKPTSCPDQLAQALKEYEAGLNCSQQAIKNPRAMFAWTQAKAQGFSLQ